MQYQYTQPPLQDHIQNLIRIVINSLEAQFHQCKRIPATVVMDLPQPRSRDLSQPSLGPDGEDKIQESPPASPLFVSSEAAVFASRTKGISGTSSKGPGFRVYQDSSLEADDTESELVAIPESDLSDSTIHGGSAPVKFFIAIQLPISTILIYFLIPGFI